MPRSTKNSRKSRRNMTRKVEFPKGNNRGTILGLPIENADHTASKATPKVSTNYQGAPIPATKVYRREMPEFKNCKAYCWMLINEAVGTYTFANSYNGETPRSSFDPSHYTYELNERTKKLIARKAEQMVEIEVTDWPEWVSIATKRRNGRK